MALINGSPAGTCAEGDGCLRWHCRLCGEYWLGLVWHDCPRSPAIAIVTAGDALAKYFEQPRVAS